MTTQTEIINLEDLVPTNHLYRKFSKLIDLDKITNKHLTTIAGNSNYKGYGINTLFKTLLLQHLEDISCQVSPRYSLLSKTTLRNISGFLINKSGFKLYQYSKAS
jgi:hypothetical protein